MRLLAIMLTYLMEMILTFQRISLTQQIYLSDLHPSLRSNPWAFKMSLKFRPSNQTLKPDPQTSPSNQTLKKSLY